MTNHSTIPSAPAHAKHIHCCGRDTHGKFLPEHERCFPERPKNDTRNGNAPAPHKDFPDTGTPDTLLKAHQQEEEFERSEQVTAAGHIVPEATAAEWIEPEQDDWLDKDAAQ